MLNIMTLSTTKVTLLLLAIATAALLWSSTAAAASPGAVFTLTNETAGNSVAVFERSADGTLVAAGEFDTGGLGSGGGLGSQGAVILSQNNRFLFAVNAGSDDISAFRIEAGVLALTDKVSSGGDRPISLTTSGNLLYALNAGGSGNISGFTISNEGQLSPLVGSTRSLSSAASGPAQVEFSPNGRLLVVTEKATNVISTYTVEKNGLASGPNIQASAGATPFGFAFDRQGDLIVSEAFGGNAGVSAVSSYDVSGAGDLDVITASAGSNQTAACWIVVTNDGRFTYTTNTGSGSISRYSIGSDGSLTLLDADGRTGVTGDGSSPIDMSLSVNSRYLYTLNTGTHTISAFEVESDGSLTPIPGVGGLPGPSVGLAAY
jgi:6-phosphogluconolactonase (cycloisomerase 2 family)